MSNSFSEYNPVVYSIRPKKSFLADEVLTFFDDAAKAEKVDSRSEANEELIFETKFCESAYQEHEA